MRYHKNTQDKFNHNRKGRIQPRPQIPKMKISSKFRRTLMQHQKHKKIHQQQFI
jgi:hypothetical protein